MQCVFHWAHIIKHEQFGAAEQQAMLGLRSKHFMVNIISYKYITINIFIIVYYYLKNIYCKERSKGN